MESTCSTATEVEEDPVVKEIPIYLSKKLEDELYVFQYPLQPRFLKNDANVRKAYFKPANQEVKLEVELNTESPNFDPVKAEDIAREVDSNKEAKKGEKEVFFENDIMDKITLQSCKAVKDPRKYAVGLYNGKELHLTPLKGFIQLRPSFSHLDKSLKRKREAAHTEEESDEEEPSTSAQQVTVKFGKTGEKKTRETFKSLQEKSNAEPWIEYEWHKDKSTLSEIQKQKLIAEDTDDHSQATNISATEYIRVLVPEDREEAQVTPSLPSHVMSLHSLRALPLLEQCRMLLKDAKIMQFQQLFLLLAGGEGITAESLLKYLPQVAVLVRGNWIVKSEVLYPNGTFSAISGVPAELMCKARDYVLLLFTQSQYVDRRKVSSLIRIPAEELKEILTGMSRLRHNKGWELSLAPDADFILKHHDIVQRQSVLWEQKSKQLSDFLSDTREKTRQRRKSKSASEDIKTKSESSGRQTKESISSDTDSGTEKSKSPPSKKRKLNTDGCINERL
ncbi:RPC5 protein [Popillia japonica]|uniref:RPC5 protein n=1 Tax=Popillia japonica TaxID=7064 RepID=A0AAW1N448_POPJA